MKLHIGRHDFSELWDGVYYKALSDYPQVSDHEMKDILDFLIYHRQHGRHVQIEADDPHILTHVLLRLQSPETYRHAPPPPILRECTACPARGGCMTDLVCHTAPAENAEAIFRCGSLLSAVNARKLPAHILAQEARNAARDPEDYFHYVMFAWGNCQAGDRLVMERLLGRSPTAAEMSPGFTPGIRFFFRYEDLDKHPSAVHDGVLPIKVRDGVDLAEYACAIVIPQIYKSRFARLIPGELEQRVHYLDHSGLDVWQWSEKVYSFISELAKT